MRIYVDFDDILCETAISLCALAAREFGRDVPYSAMTSFNLQHVFGFSDAEMTRFFARTHTFDLLTSYPETPGAVKGLRALRDAGHDVEIITGRPASAHRGTEAWLAQAGLTDFAVTYVDKYGRFRAAGPDEPRTVPLAELLERHYDLAIDDSPSVLPALAVWTKTRILVFDRPWNATFALAPNMRRVRNWKEILEYA